MADLSELIEVFAAARAAFFSAPVDDDCPNEWEAYCEAENAIIVYPCGTIEHARLKARFFLDNEGPNDTLRNDTTDDCPTLDLFLRSLLGEDRK